MNIAVDPNQQATGIGRKLLQFIISESRKTQARELILGTGTFGIQHKDMLRLQLIL